MFSASGEKLGEISVTGTTVDQSCGGMVTQAVDANGNLFLVDGPAQSANGTLPRVHTFDEAGSPRWESSAYLPSVCLSDDARHQVRAMTVGADDNLYLVLQGGPQCPRSAINLVSFDGVTGALRFNKSLGLNGPQTPTFMPHTDGVVLLADRKLRHFDYSGNEVAGATPLPNEADGFVWPNTGVSGDHGGRVFTLEGAQDASCAAGGRKQTALAVYDAGQLSWRVPTPQRCIADAAIRAMPSGGAVTLLDLGVPAGGAAGNSEIAVYDREGNQSWSAVLSNVDGDSRLGYFDSLQGVDMNGNIVIERMYIRGDNADYNNFRYLVLDGATGEVRTKADTASLPERDTFVPWFTPVALGDNHIYAKLFTCPNRAMNPFGCPEGEVLLAFNVPGVGIDYPRGALFDAPPQSPITVTPSTGIVGTDFTAEYACAGSPGSSLTRADGQPTTGVELGIPVAGNGVDYVQGIRIDVAGTYVLRVECNGGVLESSGITVTDPFAYVSLGDSYSSGEGVEPFFELNNACHRSTLAYSTQVNVPTTDTTFYSLRGEPYNDWGFLACSGATTRQVLNKQLNRRDDETNTNYLRVNDRTRLVTITIGGNDVRFADILKFCGGNHADCPNQRFQGETLSVRVESLLAELGPKLVQVYEKIHQRAPDARILVLGYPQVFPEQAEEQNCASLRQYTLRGKSAGFSQSEQNYLRNVGVQLNERIDESVALFSGATGVGEFVPVADTFAGHEVCGNAGQWINGPVLRPDNAWPPVQTLPGTFHPSVVGQQEYAEVVNEYLAQHP
jgi:lysophospholipase L1-like esterase